jgi:urate oxidase
MPEPRYDIAYGKAAIPVYRHDAAPLEGVPAVPESPFTGRSNRLFAAEIDVEVFGDNFLPAYTHGDNSMVVATDSMKNFVLRSSAAWTGATLESLLEHLGRRLLDTYEAMESLRMTGRELRFDPQPGAGALYARSHDDGAEASLDLEREGDAVVIAGHRCGRTGIELLKTTGSSFTHFVRDDFTTLPERRDRPLFIHMDVGWRYTDVADAVGPARRYAPAEQVRDVCAAVFDGLVSESIQHLVHEMGLRLLDRFPQLGEVSFTAQNRTRDPVADGVYSDPFNAYGTIALTLRR